ncbi:MAG: hypothetical protein Q9210_001754 [Variospora velana]
MLSRILYTLHLLVLYIAPPVATTLDARANSADLTRPGGTTILQADALVNPIPMPSRPFSINFRSRLPSLDVREAQSTIDLALEKIAAHIRQDGNGPLPSGGSDSPLRWRSRTLHLSIHAYVQTAKTKLTYGDAAAVLRLLKLKLMLEGYDGWLGKIFVTETAQVVGYVDLRRIPRVPPEVAPVEVKALRQVRRREVLPNPYPVPDRPFVIDFDQQGDQFPTLAAADVDRCINDALQLLIQHVQMEGDDSIPHEISFYNRTTKLEVTMTSIRNDAMLSYNDTVVIIAAMSLKMRRDGYRARLGHIIATSTGDLLGNVGLRRVAVGESPPDGRDVKNDSTNAERQMLRLNPVPNPYPLPNSAYSIDFHAPDTQASPLPAGEVRTCISRARARITKQLAEHGDGPLPYSYASFLYRYRSVYLLIGCPLEPADRRLHYSDALAVVTACAVKTTHEGYHSRVGDVFNTATDEWKGDVEIGAYQPNQVVGNTNETQLGLALMPNPYPLPNTDLLLDFEEPGMPLAVTDVQQCIFTARRQVLEDIARHGEDSPAPPSMAYRWQSVEFRIFPEPVGTQRRLTLGELLTVLDGYALKSIREGYRSRWGRIVVAGVEEQIIAEALLTSAANGEVTTS